MTKYLGKKTLSGGEATVLRAVLKDWLEQNSEQRLIEILRWPESFTLANLKDAKKKLQLEE